MTRWTQRVSTHLAVDVVVLLTVLALHGRVVQALHAPALRPLHEARARDAARAARGGTQRPGAPGALRAVHGATAASAVPLVRLVVTARAPALGLLTKGERINCHTSSKCSIRPHTASIAFLSHIVQELCESRGGHPGLSVLTSLLVSVDVKLY